MGCPWLSMARIELMYRASAESTGACAATRTLARQRTSAARLSAARSRERGTMRPGLESRRIYRDSPNASIDALG